MAPRNSLLCICLLFATSIYPQGQAPTRVTLEDLAAYSRDALKEAEENDRHGLHLFNAILEVEVVLEAPPGEITEDGKMTLESMRMLANLQPEYNAETHAFVSVFQHGGQSFQLFWPNELASVLQSGFAQRRPQTLTLHLFNGTLSDFSKVHSMIVLGMMRHVALEEIARRSRRAIEQAQRQSDESIEITFGETLVVSTAAHFETQPISEGGIAALARLRDVNQLPETYSEDAFAAESQIQVDGQSIRLLWHSAMVDLLRRSRAAATPPRLQLRVLDGIIAGSPLVHTLIVTGMRIDWGEGG